MCCMLGLCGSFPIVQSRVFEHSPVTLPQLTRRQSLLPCGSTQQPRRSNRRTQLTAARAQPRPVAPQIQPDLRISAQQILSSLEAVAWLCAAGLQACAFVLSHQQFQQRQQLLALQESDSDSEYCQAEQPSVLQDTWTDHLCTSPSLITQSAVCAIIVASIIGRCRQWLSHGR